MLENKEGQQIPEINFQVQEDNNWQSWSTNELFKGKRVILFSLPGAFTPTCSSTHLPRYNELAPIFKRENIDNIYCLSVNDTFVMNAWKEGQDSQAITFLPDGNGEFSAGMGMLVDKSDIGFGKRSWRYSMLVDDGIIKKMFIEPNVPGDPFEVSDADTMLKHIAPSAKAPAKVSIISKSGCPHCLRAKKVLDDNGFGYEEIKLGQNGLSFSSLTALSGQTSTPQIFIDGQHIGGADELEQWLS